MLPTAGAEVELSEDAARCQAAHLHVGQSDSEVLRLAARPTCGLFGANGVVADEFEGAVEGGGVVAAVVEQAGRRLEGEFLGSNEVAATDLDRINQRAGESSNGALDPSYVASGRPAPR